MIFKESGHGLIVVTTLETEGLRKATKPSG
jgi:hypothetical protein